MSDRLELLRHLWRKDAPVPTRPVATIPFGDGMWWRGGFHLDERGRAKIAGFCIRRAEAAGIPVKVFEEEESR